MTVPRPRVPVQRVRATVRYWDEAALFRLRSEDVVILDANRRFDPSYYYDAPHPLDYIFGGAAPASLWSDPSFVRRMLKRDWRTFQFASSTFRGDRAWVTEAIHVHGDALLFASAHLRASRDLLLLAVARGSRVYATLPSDFQLDRDVALAAVRRSGSLILSVPPPLLGDADVVLEAMSGPCKVAMNVVDRSLLSDASFLLRALHVCEWALLRADDQLRADRDFMYRAIDVHPRAFDYASAHLRTDREMRNRAAWRRLRPSLVRKLLQGIDAPVPLSDDVVEHILRCGWPAAPSECS